MPEINVIKNERIWGDIWETDFVTVRHNKLTVINKTESVSINWAAIGNCDINTAKAFLAELQECIRIAEGIKIEKE